MKINILGSGSKGNCYALKSKNSTLLIECGVDFKLIKQSMGYDFSNLVGCILTHEHGDHSKSAKEIVKHGVNLYASSGTIEALKINSNRVHKIENKKVFKCGDFEILPFDVCHDAKEPMGFLINHFEMGVLLFITDASRVDYLFNGVNNIMIEANYNEGKMQESNNNYHIKRVRKTHMSLENCVNYINAMDYSSVSKIIMLHLSDSNSDERLIKEVVEENFNRNVFIAQNGMEIELTKTIF